MFLRSLHTVETVQVTILTSHEKVAAAVVKLVKQKHGGLGFLVKQRTLKPFVLVASIVAGGVAEESGLVQVGSTLVILISVPS